MKVLLRITTSIYVYQWVTGQLTAGYETPSQWSSVWCNETVPCYSHALCILHECQCDLGYQFHQDGGHLSCKTCPEVHNTCDTCCYPHNTTICHNNVCTCLDNNESYACSILYQRDQFRLATEIALGAALTMAIISLLALVWKTCSRRRLVGRRDVTRQRNNSAASLTSVQLLVAERMRDRPPGYNDRRHIRIEKPPSYEDSLHRDVLECELNTSESTNASTSSMASQASTRQAVRQGECAAGGQDNPSFVICDQGRRKHNTKKKDSLPAELYM